MDVTSYLLGKKSSGGGGGGSVKPNIFVQTTEPETKDGIWVQTDKEYDNIIVDENVYASGQWALNDRDLALDGYYKLLFNYNGNYYLINDNISSLKKITGNQLVTITPTNPDSAYTGGLCCQVGNKIYVQGGYSYSYFAYLDLDTMIIHKDPDFKSGASYPTFGTKVAGDDCIYLFNTQTAGGQSNPSATYKYDINTNTTTYLANMPSQLSTGGYIYSAWSTGIRVGNNIYLFTTNPSNSSNISTEDKKYIFCMKYNITNNIFENGFKTSVYAPDGFILCPQLLDNKIVIYSTGQGVYTYNTTNSTFSKYADDFTDEYIDKIYTSLTSSGFIDNTFNLFINSAYMNGSSSVTHNVNKTKQLDLVSKTYTGNKLILQQYIPSPRYYTKVFELDELKTPISNVYIYNNNELLSDLPTYIGDGTSWTKIKG